MGDVLAHLSALLGSLALLTIGASRAFDALWEFTRDPR